MGIKLSKENKNNILVIGIFIAIAALFFQFVYFPKLSEVSRLNKECKKVKSEIDELYNFIGGQENLKDRIIKMHDDVIMLQQAFPFENEAPNIIRQLNEEASRFKVDVVSMRPGDLGVYTDAQGSALNISNYRCKFIPLSLKIEARYQALGEFLLYLEADKKPMILITQLDIKKDDNIAPNIKADIDLRVFVLVE